MSKDDGALQAHVGVHVRNLITVQRNIRANGLTPILDGDGWQVWGEEVGRNGNDDTIMHVVINVPAHSNVDEVIRRIEVAGLGYLCPMRDEFREYFVVVTLASDWSDVVGSASQPLVAY